MSATLYLATGEQREIEPVNPPFFTFDELRPLIGCDYIEVLHLPNGRVLLFDEEGKFKPSPKPNAMANLIALLPGDEIVGNVVACRSADFQ